MEALFTKSAVINGNKVELHVQPYDYFRATVIFSINGLFCRFDTERQHPGICKFLIKAFREAVEWANEEYYILSCTAYDEDNHTKLRNKTYSKFFPVFCEDWEEYLKPPISCSLAKRKEVFVKAKCYHAYKELREKGEINLSTSTKKIKITYKGAAFVEENGGEPYKLSISSLIDDLKIIFTELYHSTYSF